MKIIGTLMLVGGLILGTLSIIGLIQANYDYEQNYSSYWSLSEKASTISQKSEYMDKFVDALSKSGLQGENSSLFWKTNNTSFDQNFKALQSLQQRLHDIKGMDESSFAYQTAIQQITAQEQGEAKTMLDVLEGCWWKVHHYWFYNPWLGLLIIIGLGILLIGGVGLLLV